MGNSKAPSGQRPGRLHSKDLVDAAWRAEQARVDADIEGLARDPDADRLVEEMSAAGATPLERIARLRAYFMQKAQRIEK